MPKGARIGAYLESLRQNNMSTTEEPPQAINPVLDQTEITPRSLSPRTNIRTQPQMIRSNSSSGVTTFHSGHPPSSPTSGKLNRNRNINRTTNPCDVRSSLRSFKTTQNSTFRGGSPSRSIQPTLADLEFPPPPTDLPPPPEEFDSPTIDQVDCSTSIMTSSQELKKRIIPISPLTTKKITREPLENFQPPPTSESSDVSTLQPSVEEASSRFGVSLKKRDNVFSDGGKDELKEKSPIRTSLSLSSPSLEGKSPMSIDSDVPAVGSPLEPLPPPLSILGNGEFKSNFKVDPGAFILYSSDCIKFLLYLF